MSYNYLKLIKNLIIKYKAMPIQLIYFVTNKCNCKCQHCFFWKKLNKKKKELNLNEIKKISKSIGTFPFLNISGGEPFLRNDLDKIIKIFYENSNIGNVVIPTNGFDTPKIIDITKKILKVYKNHLLIYISIDSFEKEHDRIRGIKNSFKNAINTYKELKKLKKEFSNLNVGILTTLSAFNQNTINDFYIYIKKEIKPDSFYLNILRGDPKNINATKIDINKYIKLCKKIEKDLRNGILKGHSQSKFLKLTTAMNILTHNTIIKTLETNKYQIPCYAGVLNAVMFSEGDIYPCELLNKKIGNIRNFNYDFKKLWKSKQANKIRNHIKKSKCFCTHECFLNTNILFNLKKLPRLLQEIIK